MAAAAATVARIDADIRDSVLSSPRDGRVQYLIAQPGEVVPGGAAVLNVVDIGDVFMTFFLPTAVVGRVPLGSEVRIVLDTRNPRPRRCASSADSAWVACSATASGRHSSCSAIPCAPPWHCWVA